METDGGKMCESASASFNFADFDFLDLVPATPTPPQPTAAPVTRHVTTPYKTIAEPLTTMPMPMEASATRGTAALKKKSRSLAGRIASVDELARKLRLRDTERDQLASQLHDFQRIAGDVQTLYEDEKRQRQQLVAEHKRLESEYARIDDDLAHRTLQYDQLKAQWDEFSGPLKYGELAVHYLKLTQKLDEAKLLHWSEQARVQEMQKYCKQHELSVPSPPKSPAKKRKRKSEKSVQCELWRQEPAPPTLPEKPKTRDQFTQHISTATTRSTSTACFIKRRDVATNFPERAPLPPLKQIIQELQKWTCVDPVSPLNDLPQVVGTPPVTTPAAPTPLLPLRTLKTQGTCTWLCNIQRQIDFLPAIHVNSPIKRSISRPPSRLAFDVCGVKHELSTTPPPLASPTATAPAYLPLPLTPPAVSANTTPNTNTPPSQSNFLQFSSPSALSHLSPAAFEQLWQVFGQMLLGLLQPRNGIAANSSSAVAVASDALSQQEFHNWMRSLYDKMQQQQEVPEPPDLNAAPATQSLDAILHRPQARCSDDAVDNDDGNRTPTRTDNDRLSSPHHQSIGTSPIHFDQPEEVQLEEHENMINQHNTFVSERSAHINAAAEVISCIRLPQLQTAAAFRPHSNGTLMPPPSASINGSCDNITNDNETKAQRKAMKKLLKQSKRKPKQAKNKTSKKFKNESGIAEVGAKETAVDFLATLSNFKAETAGDNVPFINFDEAEELGTSMQEVLANNLITQNDDLKKDEPDFSTISKEDTLEERQTALRAIEHSLFGSDTDMDSSEEDNSTSKQIEAVVHTSLPNSDTLDESFGEVFENATNCVEIEQNTMNSEKGETEALISGYRDFKVLDSEADNIEIPSEEEEQIQPHEMHETSVDKDNILNVHVENKPQGEALLALVEEQTLEIITEIVESYGELKSNNATDIVFKTANNEESDQIVESKNTIIEISSDVSNAISNIATTAELDDNNQDLIINEESEKIDEAIKSSIIEISSDVSNAISNITPTAELDDIDDDLIINEEPEEIVEESKNYIIEISSGESSAVYNTATAESRTTELDNRNREALPKTIQTGNEVINTINNIQPSATECGLLKSFSPNKHCATSSNLFKSIIDSEANVFNEYMQSQIPDIEISETSNARFDKRTKQCESTPETSNKLCKSDENVFTKFNTIVNTELLTSPRKLVTGSQKFKAISPIKDSRVVALILQNNERYEQELIKIEKDEISNSTDSHELGDETALIDSNLLNELLNDSTTNHVVNEMLNEAAATSPSKAAHVAQLECDFETAINELEEKKKSSAQTTPQKRGRKRKIELLSPSTTAATSNKNSVVCKRSERLRAKQLILNPNTESFLTPVILGKYTTRKNIPINELENGTSQFESLKPKKSAVITTDFSEDDEDNLSRRINMGFFKERSSDETTSIQMATTTLASNIKNCDNLLEQRKQEEEEKNPIPPNKWSAFGANQPTHLAGRLIAPNDERVREHFHSFQRKVKSAQTIAIVKPTSFVDSKLPTQPLACFAHKDDDTTTVTNVVNTTTSSHVVHSLCMLTEVHNDIPMITTTDFVSYDEPPASPTNQYTCESADSHESMMLPKEIPLELSANYQPRHPKKNSLLKRLVNVYAADENCTVKPELEKYAKIETQLKARIQQFLHDNKTNASSTTNELLQITRDGCGSDNYQLISNAIVAEMREVTRPEHERNCYLNELPPFALSNAHQRIADVMRHLQDQRLAFASDIMTVVEAVLFNKKNSDQLALAVALNLTQLYLLAAGQLSQATYNPARLFIAKCLYFHKLKSWPMIYEVLCRFPTVLPHRDDRSYDRSDALITVIQHTLMCNKYEMERIDLRPKELLSKLRFEYHFEPFKPERSDVLINLVEKLKAGRLAHLTYAFALLCKRMRPQQVESDVLQKYLVPLANEYYTRVQQSCTHDASAAALLGCISMLVKPFPIEDANIAAYLDLFARFLNVVDRAPIQEAAVQSVLRLQRFGAMNCYNVLVDFAPSYELQPITKAVLKTFAHRRSMHFWRDCDAQARMGAEH